MDCRQCLDAMSNYTNIFAKYVNTVLPKCTVEIIFIHSLRQYFYVLSFSHNGASVSGAALGEKATLGKH